MYGKHFFKALITLMISLVLSGCNNHQSTLNKPDMLSNSDVSQTEMLGGQGSAQSRQDEVETTCRRALQGNKSAIRKMFVEMRHSDASMSEELYDSLARLLVEQTTATLKVLSDTDPDERKGILWSSIASESANPPKELRVSVEKYKADYPTIYQEVVQTIDAGHEYMRLYSTKGEAAAVEYMKKYFEQK